MDIHTGITARWSDELEEVISLRHPSGEEVQLSPLDAGTVELPVVVRYPEGYDERLERLLGNPKNVREGDVLVQHFPDAQQDPEAVRRGLHDLIQRRAREVLGSTDWAILRKFELGKEIPEKIIELRAAARAAVAADEQALSETPDTGLTAFTTKNLDGVAVDTEQYLEHR